MKARLVSYSQSTPDFGDLGEMFDLIAYCAKVSNTRTQGDLENAEKLINYLIKHKHWSPFEMVSACIEIESTRDIVRQLLRHRSFSFQEFSQRYADPTQDLDFVIRDARLQDMANRQNSIVTDDKELQKTWATKQQQIIHEAKMAYTWAVENGIAKEQARVVLPEGNTVSKVYVNGTLRSWIHYIELRSGNGTQLEHMELARECAVAISRAFPMIDDFVETE